MLNKSLHQDSPLLQPLKVVGGWREGLGLVVQGACLCVCVCMGRQVCKGWMGGGGVRQLRGGGEGGEEGSESVKNLENKKSVFIKYKPNEFLQ